MGFRHRQRKKGGEREGRVGKGERRDNPPPSCTRARSPFQQREPRAPTEEARRPWSSPRYARRCPSSSPRARSQAPDAIRRPAHTAREQHRRSARAGRPEQMTTLKGPWIERRCRCQCTWLEVGRAGEEGGGGDGIRGRGASERRAGDGGMTEREHDPPRMTSTKP